MRTPDKVSTADKRDPVLGNEEGSVIVLALIILMLLTMIGTSATNTSTLENQVAGNERNYKQNFFKAEAAALQGAQRIQLAPTHTQDPIKDDNDAAVQANGVNGVASDYAHTAARTLPDTDGDGQLENLFDRIANWEDLEAETTADHKDTHYMIIYTGIAPWSSLDMTSPTQVRAFSVYGQRLNTASIEKMIIETGFARRM